MVIVPVPIEERGQSTSAGRLRPNVPPSWQEKQFFFLNEADHLQRKKADAPTHSQAANGVVGSGKTKRLP